MLFAAMCGGLKTGNELLGMRCCKGFIYNLLLRRIPLSRLEKWPGLKLICCTT